MSLEEIPLQLSRHAFGPRDFARAGDLWRLCQDAAVLGSSRRGWPPERYRDEQCAFVVRKMTAVHPRLVRFGTPIVARTWVSTFRRGMITDRQVRLRGREGLICGATQQWVHVAGDGRSLQRASPTLESAFPLVVDPDDGDIELPAWAPVADPREHVWDVEIGYTQMDPLGHLNHPAVVDLAEEALARWVVPFDPQGLVPVAESVTWRAPIVAPERIRVWSSAIGSTGQAIVSTHRLVGPDDGVRAEAILVRCHEDVPADRLIAALR